MFNGVDVSIVKKHHNNPGIPNDNKLIYIVIK